MSREIDTLTYEDRDYNFIELLYYNGSKLCVNMEQRYILAWNKEFDNHERWFLIKASNSFFNGYISGNMTLLEVMKNSAVETIKRTYDNYDNLVIIDVAPNLNDYKLPGDVSYLGFDFFSEHNYSKILATYTKSYTTHVGIQRTSTRSITSTNDSIWTNFRVNTSRYHTREAYVA